MQDTVDFINSKGSGFGDQSWAFGEIPDSVCNKTGANADAPGTTSGPAGRFLIDGGQTQTLNVAAGVVTLKIDARISWTCDAPYRSRDSYPHKISTYGNAAQVVLTIPLAKLTSSVELGAGRSYWNAMRNDFVQRLPMGTLLKLNCMQDSCVHATVHRDDFNKFSASDVDSASPDLVIARNDDHDPSDGNGDVKSVEIFILDAQLASRLQAALSHAIELSGGKKEAF